MASALVRLLDGERVATQVLSNESGCAVLTAPSPGTYRLKVDRIGWVGTTTPLFILAAGESLPFAIRMPTLRLELPTLEVQVRGSRCGRRTEAGPRAAALWAEIEKALTASVLTERADPEALVARRFRREVGLDGRVHREWTTYAAMHQGRFFAAPSPATTAQFGFVLVDARDSVTYTAPDADLLLSDTFVLAHCFRAVEGDSGLVGLAFEPVDDRRVVEMEGTLWLDRDSKELRSLDFAYRGLPPLLRDRRLGGRVEFARLPSGGWIVGSWSIRTPILEEIPSRASRLPPRIAGRANARDQTVRVAGYLELGGRITAEENTREVANAAIVAVRVTDSTTGAGLAGARAFLGATPDVAVTDSTGQAFLRTAASGPQIVRAVHPKLRLPGALDSVEAILSIGSTAIATLTVPSPATIARTRCGRRTDRSGVVGMAFGEDSLPLVGAEIRAEWRTPAGTTKQVREPDRRQRSLRALQPPAGRADHRAAGAAHGACGPSGGGAGVGSLAVGGTPDRVRRNRPPSQFRAPGEVARDTSLTSI